MIFRKLQRIAIVLAVLGAIGILTVFFNRHTLANWALDRVKEEFRENYQATFAFNSVAVHGLSGFSGKDFFIVQDNKDTLIKAEALSFELDWYHTLVRGLKFKSFSIRDGYFHPVKKGKEDNYSFLIEDDDSSVHSDSAETFLGNTLRNFLSASFDILPARLKISGLNCIVAKDDQEYRFRINKFSLFDNKYTSSIEISETGQTVVLEGQVGKRTKINW
jgi:hypothetical protein